MEHYDILIVGGGAAGISAARECVGARVLLADRKPRLGGVLLQCAHQGFGKGRSGIRYAQELVADFPDEIALALETTVLSVFGNRTALLSGRKFGRKEISFSQLILATGCREIPAGALPIAGSRPRGVYTAGQMQELMNVHGYRPEGPAVILGSGDLGLIMAKHLAQAGISVTLVEKLPHCGGMPRNRNCLREYPIKLLCNATVTEVIGKKQLEAVKISDRIQIPCRTLLIAAGLRPERELVEHLGEPQWLQVCGNCNTVHPIVEAVTEEGRLAGIAAMENLRGAL